MQSSKTTAYIQLLKYWLIAPLLSKESAISKKESAKKSPTISVGVNFLRRRPCGIQGIGWICFSADWIHIYIRQFRANGFMF